MHRFQWCNCISAVTVSTITAVVTATLIPLVIVIWQTLLFNADYKWGKKFKKFRPGKRHSKQNTVKIGITHVSAK